MAKIIAFQDAQKAAIKADPGEFQFSLDVYIKDGQPNAAIKYPKDLETKADRDQAIADLLDTLSWLLRAGESEDPVRGQLLATTMIFANGACRARTQFDKFQTEEQIQWLMEQVDASKSALLNTLDD